MTKRLKVVGPGDQKLGRTTIMDRALAQKHGLPYVHLAAFAIDIDRVRELLEDDESLPFGFEVALVDLYLTHIFMQQADGRALAILEDTALEILELPRPSERNPAPLGSQLVFAIFTATYRGALPESLRSCFDSWPKLPTDLAEDVEEMLKKKSALKRAIASCLGAELSPPLVEPVRAALSVLDAELL